jgi:hypothetical protein
MGSCEETGSMKDRGKEKCMRPLLLMVLMIAALGCSSEQDSWPKKKFVAEEWAKTSESERYIFARDLTESHALVGKTASEVKQLLGTPSYDVEADHYFTYVIKIGGYAFNQIYILDVRVNPATGKIESAGIRGD